MLILPDEFSIFNDFDVELYCLEYAGPRPYCNHEGLAISIFKWRRIVEEIRDCSNLYRDGDVSTCGLCLLYNHGGRDSACLDCPIYKETGEVFCMNTPYYDYPRAYEEDDFVGALAAAEGELAFLEGLWDKLPPHEEDHED
jgi:hypothetical protein